MIDPKEGILVSGPEKGECSLCEADLSRQPHLKIETKIPIIKTKKVIGRSCLDCAKKLVALTSDLISRARSERSQP